MNRNVAKSSFVINKPCLRSIITIYTEHILFVRTRRTCPYVSLISFLHYSKVGQTVKVLSDNKYFVPQTRVLVSKIKEAWGRIDSWDDVKLKDLGQLLKGLEKKDISMLIDNTVKVKKCHTVVLYVTPKLVSEIRL